MSRSDEIKYCYVCVNLSCAEAGSQKIINALGEQLAGTDVEVRTQVCFGACWTGPNVVLYPQGTWYSNVNEGDVDEIVAHVKGGPKVDRLVNKVDADLLDLVLAILETSVG